jgi:NADH-quinone oxidoreductase subunit M
MTSLFTLLHFGLALVVASILTAAIAGRSGAMSEGMRSDHTFMPSAVPGDPGNENDSYQTTWRLFELHPPHPHQPPTEVQLFLGLDGLNVWLVVLTSLMTMVAVLVSWDSTTERPASYYGWLLAMEGLVCGAFTSFDVVLFYVFFELTLIPAFFLIGGWGVGGGRRDAARKFFLYTLTGSLLTLTGLVGIVLTNPTPIDPHSPIGMPQYRIPRPLPGEVNVVKPLAGAKTFSIPQLAQNVETWSVTYHGRAHYAEQRVRWADENLEAIRERQDRGGADPDIQRILESASVLHRTAVEARSAAVSERDTYLRVQTWLFVLLMAGFAVKIPIVPFHSWLPAAYFEAPTAVTLILAAVLSKLGTYGVLRLVLPFTPDASLAYGLPVFGTLAAVGLIYAAFCALAQNDLKLLIAYSSVSHLGFLIIGLFAFNEEGIGGATLHMVNHGLSTGALFAVLAILANRYRSLSMNQFSGLWAIYPGLTFLTVVAALASVGVPGLNNFVSEMLMLAGVFDPPNTQLVGYSLGAASAIGILLSAWYMMTMLRRVYFGPLVVPTGQPQVAAGQTGREVVAVGLPVLLCIVLGLYPQPVLDSIRIDAAVVAQFGNNARLRAHIGIAPTRSEQNQRFDSGGGANRTPPGQDKFGVITITPNISKKTKKE